MNISGVNQYGGAYVNHSRPINNASGNDFKGVMAAAIEQTERQETGDVLGITMIKEPGTDRCWGMKAKFAGCSTPDSPVIYVETNYGGKTVSYNININEVNPNNASRMEMFALCSYKDAMGMGDKSTFGTFNTLRSFAEMANHNSYINSTSEPSTFDQFQKEKLDWFNMSIKVTDLLLQCNDLKQYQKGLKIMDMFTKQLESSRS